VRRAITGVAALILTRETGGITGCSDTALVTTVLTSGTSPATADMVRLVEPWQWTTALRSSAPVRSSTVRTAEGWSNTAAWSSVHGLGSTSVLARQFSIHTSHPASTSRSTRVVSTGARKMLARTPAPWTRSTGPRVGALAPSTWTRLRARPSPAAKGTTVV
jgi:hypothetical protein